MSEQKKRTFSTKEKFPALGLSVALALGAVACAEKETVSEPTTVEVSIETTDTEPVTPEETPIGHEVVNLERGTLLEDLSDEARYEYLNSLELFEFFKEFEISATDYTSPETISDAYYTRYEMMMDSGLSLHQDYTLFYATPEATAPRFEERFDSTIQEKLFTDDSRNLTDSIFYERKVPYITRYDWTRMAGEVEYKESQELIDTVLMQGGVEHGGFIVRNSVHLTDNANENSISEIRKRNNYTPVQYDIMRFEEVTFELSDDNTWKVSDVRFWKEPEVNY